MTFHYTDPDGDHIEAVPLLDANGPAVSILITNVAGRAVADIPVDRVEELIAGLRDTARQAATRPTPEQHACDGFPLTCPNLCGLPPHPPTHFGGIRCGCNDRPQEHR